MLCRPTVLYTANLRVIDVDSECDKTVSVVLDGLETTLNFVELPLPVQKVHFTHRLLAHVTAVDCLRQSRLIDMTHAQMH